jgi:hypothetical protein
MSQTICYCFDYTTADIEQDVRENQGRSAILERIVVTKKQSGCQCETMHPEKR